jgi:transaldolase
MQRTAALGTDFWNDSCDPRELSDALEHGAVGATSNPVIVGQVVEADRDTWFGVLDALVRDAPHASEEEIAWRLVREVARRASSLLDPVYRATGGLAGFLSVQVDPKWFRNADRMIEHAAALVGAAPNLAAKIPATDAGLAAIESLTARGVRTNATVCTTLSQAIACAEAAERGLVMAADRGLDTSTLRPNVTIMVGRLDDHLRRVVDADGVSIPPGHLDWAGIAVFKRAHRVFRERGFRSQLLAAAFRHHLHWFELVGEGVAHTIPYVWWTRFNRSGLEPRRTLGEPLDPEVLGELYERVPDFRLAYDEGAIEPGAFASYGASTHTLNQFLGGSAKLCEIVRARMLR